MKNDFLNNSNQEDEEKFLKVFDSNNPEEITKKFKQDLITFLVLLNGLIIFLIMATPTVMYKPAIYLYPSQPTKVNLTLDKTIVIQTNIPKYHNGWNVLAYPNGKIVDLQPQFTDCDKLESDRFGFEYAKDACKNNNYPYIFWEGTQISKLMPKNEDGWVVAKSEINTFLNEITEKIGFNQSEKAEFIRYWSYALDNEKSGYFFIYFIQNNEVDKYAPIYVKPKPDSTNRILMIVRPIKKLIKCKEQKLVTIKRNGFTLVEWGGSIEK